MRLDKYLKVSRIIKRRTLAKEACDGGRVSINDRAAKPSSDVSEGDILGIRFGERFSKYRVINVSDNVKKTDACLMYQVLDEDEYSLKERTQA